MDKKMAYEIVLEDLKKRVSFFEGKYDARNGKEDYMYGVSAVMECIDYSISDEVGDNFSDTFIKNMIESERKAGVYDE